MSIFPDINPNTTSGTQLATLLNSFRDSFAGMNSGTSRDADLIAGGMWVDTTNDPIWDFKVFDGTDDSVFMSLNTTTNSISFGDTSDSLSIEKITDDSLGAILELFKRRLSGSGQTLDGDTLGQVDFTGYTDGATKEVQARIETISTDNVTAGAHGSYMSIQTTSDATSSLVERIRISATGLIGLGTSTPTAKLHVSGNSTTGNIKNELLEDSATGAKTIKKKARVAGSGQVLSGDNIATDQYDSTDEAGGNVNVANIKVTATENTTTTASGTKVTVEATRDGDTSPTEEIEINNATTTFKSTTGSTSKDTGALVVEGGVGIEENLYVGGNMVVQGDTITQNVATWEVEDASLLLNKNGNQASADDVAGFEVEMSDAANAKLSYDKDAATKFKLGEVGSEVAVVDETTAQSLANKSIETPSRSDVKQDTFANLQTYASTASNGQLVFATDQKVYYAIRDNALVSVGGGGGGLDTFHTEDFEVTTSSDWSTGNNATFLTAGALVGALDDNTVTPISKDSNLRYTSAAVSINDWIASPSVALDLKQRGNDVAMTFYYTLSNANAKYEVVIWDETNSQKLNSVLDEVTVTSGRTRFSTVVSIPNNCTSIKYGFHSIQENGSGPVLEVDDFELSTNPFFTAEIANITEWEDYTPTTQGFGTPTITHARWRRVGQDMELDVKFVTGTTTAIEAQFGLPSGFTVSSLIGNNEYAGYLEQEGVASDFYSLIQTAGDSFLNFGHRGGGVSGILTPQNASVVFASARTQTFKAKIRIEGWVSTSPSVITPARSNMTDWEEYTPTTTGLGTLASTDLFYRRVGGNLEVQGRIQIGTPTAVFPEINIPAGLVIDESKLSPGNGIVGNVARNVNGTGANDYSAIYSTGNSNFINVGVYDGGGTQPANRLNANALFTASNLLYFNFSLPIEGWTSDAQFLAAIPTQKVVYLKEVQNSGVQGGTLTSGSYATRTLNSITGNTSIASLSANQFTLSAGIYLIEAEAPAFEVGRHQSKIVDITNTVDYLGSSEFSAAADNVTSKSKVNAYVSITTTAIFDLKTRVETTKTTNGGGVANSFSDDEIYSQVKITKLR